MTKIMKAFHTGASAFDKRAADFTTHHPHIAALLMFTVMPIFILLVVFLSTTVIMLPFGLIFGWF